ncbi:MAG: hypothetical protein FWF79_02160 [Defluviitaleaceae bacterium]|nr:hypothetical protein [Defluviitaleaceae bacterium]
MKNTNRHEETKSGLFERVASSIGDKLEKIATEQRHCWNAMIYEPEMSNEMIKELLSAE